MNTFLDSTSIFIILFVFCYKRAQKISLNGWIAVWYFYYISAIFALRYKHLQILLSIFLCDQLLRSITSPFKLFISFRVNGFVISLPFQIARFQVRDLWRFMWWGQLSHWRFWVLGIVVILKKLLEAKKVLRQRTITHFYFYNKCYIGFEPMLTLYWELTYHKRDFSNLFFKNWHCIKIKS